jgi:Icc-related predicted phosphoesterase
MPATTNTHVRIAAISDMHYTKASAGALHGLLAEVAERADVLVACGDLTDYGLPEEARLLAKDFTALRIPVVAVLGNHDYESGQEKEVADILRDAGVAVLDGESHEVHGIGFAGAKGFCGGFGRGVLGAWGEPAVKQFVHEAVHEALKLESALARLRTRQRIALLHYSPIRGTVEGEPLEIYPYLGCGRLEDPLLRHPVAAVFHGHAHNGTVEGRTTGGIPVYNVAMPLLRKRIPDHQPVMYLSLDPEAEPVNHKPGYEGMERRAGAAPSTSTTPA